jgi:Protein of unknown function (DUF3108)
VCWRAEGKRYVLVFARTIAAALLVTIMAAPASAQGKLDAQYTVTLAGLPIGKGSWRIDIADTQYNATATGRTTGLLHAFTGGEGTSAAHGTLQAGRIVSSLYSSIIKTSRKNDETRLTIANGALKDASVEPPQDKDPERVPITEAHQQGILDPMTASLMRVAGTGDPLSPEACPQTLSVYDGRLRYDLQMTFKRMDKVKADKGYAGPAVVCAVYFSPIAGYIPTRAAIKYIAKLRDIEVWLVPIAGTRVLVPFRLEGPTPIGHAVLEASEFVSVATPTRASANGTKTQ